MQTVVPLGQTDATQNIGVFFDVHSVENTKLTEAQFEPYIFYNSDYDHADLQLFTCGAQSAHGLEAAPGKWSTIGRGRQSRGQTRLPLQRHVHIQAGETHGFYIHTSQRKALVMMVDVSAGDFATEGAITIRSGLANSSSKTPFTGAVSPGRFYVPQGRLVFETEVKVKALQLNARQDGTGLLTIACHPIGGEMLKELNAVDPNNTFSALTEMIHCQLPPLPGTRWQIILPNAECPNGSKLDVALSDLFELAPLGEEQDQLVIERLSQSDQAAVDTAGLAEQLPLDAV